jgi:hypothetical protein
MHSSWQNERFRSFGVPIMPTVACPKCGRSLRYADGKAEQTAKCPNCNALVPLQSEPVLDAILDEPYRTPEAELKGAALAPAKRSISPVQDCAIVVLCLIVLGVIGKLFEPLPQVPRMNAGEISDMLREPD